MRRFLKMIPIAAGFALIGLCLYVQMNVQRFTPEQKVDLASTLSLPYTFASGQVIYASQMNANFQAIKSVVNALDDQNISNASITGSTKLIDGTVSLGKLGADSVNSSKIVDGSIAAADLGSDSVTTVKILDANVTNPKILDGTIGESKLDIASAPTINRYVFWNGSKLDYSASNIGPTACIGTLTAHGDYTYSGSQIAYMRLNQAFIENSATTTETNIGDLTYEAGDVMSFVNIRVRSTGSTVPVDTVFTLRRYQIANTTLTCTMTSGTSTCSTLGTATSSVAAATPMDIVVTSTGGSTVRNFFVTVCASPFL